jgi:hypothetical protein
MSTSALYFDHFAIACLGCGSESQLNRIKPRFPVFLRICRDDETLLEAVTSDALLASPSIFKEGNELTTMNPSSLCTTASLKPWTTSKPSDWKYSPALLGRQRFSC